MVSAGTCHVGLRRGLLIGWRWGRSASPIVLLASLFITLAGLFFSRAFVAMETPISKGHTNKSGRRFLFGCREGEMMSL